MNQDEIRIRMYPITCIERTNYVVLTMVSLIDIFSIVFIPRDLRSKKIKSDSISANPVSKGIHQDYK